MSSSTCNSNFSKNQGRGPELKYELYFPPNSCMPKDEGMGKCPRYPYPLQNIPTCSSIYVPCASSDNTPADKSIYGKTVNPSELYGDALAMNEGDGLFYYHNPYGFDMSLTYDHRQPFHYARTQL